MTIQTFDYSTDLLQYIKWQYDQNDVNTLIRNRQAQLNTLNQQFWTDWYRDVFDLRTANNFGLNVWALILGVDFATRVPSAGRIGFGFGSNRLNFTVSPRRGGNFTTPDPAQSLDIPVETKRLILQFRAFSLFSRKTVPEINAFLARIFASQGGAYVRDNFDMTITYMFNFVIDGSLLFAIQEYDILPKPTGVSVTFQGQ